SNRQSLTLTHSHIPIHTPHAYVHVCMKSRERNERSRDILRYRNVSMGVHLSLSVCMYLSMSLDGLLGLERSIVHIEISLGVHRSTHKDIYSYMEIYVYIILRDVETQRVCVDV